jgi:hypothetical protein
MLYNQIELEVIEGELWFDQQPRAISTHLFVARQFQERQDLQALPQLEQSSLLMKRFRFGDRAR